MKRYIETAQVIKILKEVPSDNLCLVVLDCLGR